MLLTYIDYHGHGLRRVGRGRDNSPTARDGEEGVEQLNNFFPFFPPLRCSTKQLERVRLLWRKNTLPSQRPQQQS